VGPVAVESQTRMPHLWVEFPLLPFATKVFLLYSISSFEWYMIYENPKFLLVQIYIHT